MNDAVEMVINNLVNQYPISIPLGQAGAMLNMNTMGAIYSSKHRGDFPLRITSAGGRGIVLTSDMINFLRTGESQSHLNKKKVKVKVKDEQSGGRPRKEETVEAARLGITVPQLRAQLKAEA